MYIYIYTRIKKRMVGTRGMLGWTKDRGDDSSRVVFWYQIEILWCFLVHTRLIARLIRSFRRERIQGAFSACSFFFFFFLSSPFFTHALCRMRVGREKEESTASWKSTRSRRRNIDPWKLGRPMLGEHLSATSRDGHTTRQLMPRHGCTSSRFYFEWRLLSSIFRFFRSRFKSTIWAIVCK